jgi:hypothetical protein
MQQSPFLPASFTKNYSLITNSYASPKIVRVVISRRLLLMGHAAQTQRSTTCMQNVGFETWNSIQNNSAAM